LTVLHSPLLSLPSGSTDGQLYGMIRSGELRAFRIGTLLRVRVEEVERIETGSSVNPSNVLDTPANTAKTARAKAANSRARVGKNVQS
jgi:hypothetical protein